MNLPITKITFKLEPPFTAINSNEIARTFGLDPYGREKVSGQLIVVEDREGGPMPRHFGNLDTLWSLILLAGAVNFLLSHPKAREVYLLTARPVVVQK
jgi:hypothetical protein